MSKLTDKQKQRIKENQEKQIELFNNYPQYQSTQRGVVIEPQRKFALLELNDGNRETASLRKNSGKVACGDYVIWEKLEDGELVINAVLPRRSELVRQYHNNRKIIAANIDQIIIVIAAQPEPDFKLLDQYTVVAELNHLPIAIVLNKTDLVDNFDTETPPHELNRYQDIGYPVYFSSAKKHSGIEQLRDCLKDQVSIFVGQSGVGKSSIIRELFPHDMVRVGDLNPFEHGSHTTSSIRLYRFDEGGGVIDAPGIRDFAFWDCSAQDVISGFTEFLELAAECKFSNCTHTVEPHCAVKQAVEGGRIHPERYNNFLVLYQDAAK